MAESLSFWGLMLGAFGGGYFIYAIKQKKGVAMLSAVALFAIPYFITSSFWMVAVGVLFMALPFVMNV